MTRTQISSKISEGMSDYINQMMKDEKIGLGEAVRELLARGRKARDQEIKTELPKAA